MQSSILFVLYWIGVAISSHISYYDGDVATPGTLIGPRQERRICAELCMSGLGGEPCGGDCAHMLPRGLPEAQLSASGRHDVGDADHNDLKGSARRDACPILCENQLGYPLCQCNYRNVNVKTTPFFRPDFVQICQHFCNNYDYPLYGCPKCDLIRDMKNLNRKQNSRVDWNEWCKDMCSIGEGGAACNCDLLPMHLSVATP